ncbi:MAG TPA: TPM domain-containing protein [Tahibacter sp.]|uniref:TPM domain-containing protein n=1 Tax=Tahibacter sp. TaxID=2056211 RepID=UPI002C1FD204|nr:TPM domain-containing protein [Tahibacter sp.]HSX62860.1 TPM domain-containing protein [Tahibacter sp.]
MQRIAHPFHRACLAAAVALALAGCQDSDAGGSAARPAQTRIAAAPAPAAVADPQAALVDEVASALQACSYDGAPVRVGKVGAAPPSECRDMVAQIMAFTGLPQNFTVVEAPVPNAAAVILLDDKKIPQRVIAFNKDFMGIVRASTRGNAWAPVSIMAHEIGHHLSGHTITPGGSQPPTELEADKFSGFVLYKMGASLDDAQTAMSTLVADGPDGATHPGRGKRLAAIKEGWTQACRQQGAGECGGLSQAASTIAMQAPVVTAPAAPAPARTEPARVEAAAAAPQTASVPPPRASAPAPAVAPRIAAAGGVDTIPAPGSTPSKFDRFIYDEYGVLDPAWRKQFEQRMFDHARLHGVEIVTLLVKDLHGLDGDAYAQAIMRQLRVGKLDVGNGAVLVVAPDAKQVGLAMGPGVALQMAGHDKKQSLERWLETGWPNCARKNACGNWTENFLLAADHIRRDTDDIEWTIRYQSFGELIGAYTAYNDERRESGARFDPKTDPSYEKIAQIEGKVIAVDVPDDYAGARVNAITAQKRNPLHVQTADGYALMLYVDPHTEALMPGGKLQAGRSYRFVTRVNSLSWNRKDTQSFDLLSYDSVR